MPLPLNVWLIHPDPQMCDSFRRRFIDLPNVSVLETRFEDLPPHDCFVTAGNSFGIMNAGIDAAVAQFHGESLVKAIQYHIMDQFLGEQPIGTCFVQQTGNAHCPFVAHAPTMRVPGSIAGTDKVYSATWAAFVSVYRHNANSESEDQVNTLVFPAMGAGFGGVPFTEVARQMAAAYHHYLNPPHRMDWDTVIERHKAISYDGDRQVAR